VTALARRSAPDWLGLATGSWWLWAEANMVIGMRMAGMMMRAPGHEREAVRMVTEKVKANADLAVKLALAGPMTAEAAAHKAVKHYAPKVSANRRRLSRKRRAK